MPNTLIWGSLLIIIGFSLICKTLFGISIPIIRPLVGIILLYAGFMMIVNPKSNFRTPFNTVAFSSRKLSPTKVTESFHTAFGSSTINLSKLDLQETPTTVTISTAFGSTKLIIRKDVPTRILLSTSFAYALMPDGSTHSLGNYEYNTSDQQPELIVQVNLAFSNLEVETV